MSRHNDAALAFAAATADAAVLLASAAAEDEHGRNVRPRLQDADHEDREDESDEDDDRTCHCRYHFDGSFDIPTDRSINRRVAKLCKSKPWGGGAEVILKHVLQEHETRLRAASALGNVAMSRDAELDALIALQPGILQGEAMDFSKLPQPHPPTATDDDRLPRDATRCEMCGERSHAGCLLKTPFPAQLLAIARQMPMPRITFPHALGADIVGDVGLCGLCVYRCLTHEHVQRTQPFDEDEQPDPVLQFDNEHRVPTPETLQELAPPKPTCILRLAVQRGTESRHRQHMRPRAGSPRLFTVVVANDATFADLDQVLRANLRSRDGHCSKFVVRTGRFARHHDGSVSGDHEEDGIGVEGYSPGDNPNDGAIAGYSHWNDTRVHALVRRVGRRIEWQYGMYTRAEWLLTCVSIEEGLVVAPPAAAMNEAEAEAEAEACSICFEDLTAPGEAQVVAMRCGHSYHESCLMSWFDRGRKSCPTCRTTLNGDSGVPANEELPQRRAWREVTQAAAAVTIDPTRQARVWPAGLQSAPAAGSGFDECFPALMCALMNESVLSLGCCAICRPRCPEFCASLDGPWASIEYARKSIDGAFDSMLVKLDRRLARGEDELAAPAEPPPRSAELWPRLAAFAESGVVELSMKPIPEVWNGHRMIESSRESPSEFICSLRRWRPLDSDSEDVSDEDDEHEGDGAELWRSPPVHSASECLLLAERFLWLREPGEVVSK
jgi:hypothetical protein